MGMGMMIFLASLTLIRAGLVSRLELHDEYLTFIGAFGRTTLAWREIASVTIAGNRNLRLRGGRSILLERSAFSAADRQTIIEILIEKGGGGALLPAPGWGAEIPKPTWTRQNMFQHLTAMLAISILMLIASCIGTPTCAVFAILFSGAAAALSAIDAIRLRSASFAAVSSLAVSVLLLAGWRVSYLFAA
jgi:hypothetical protein